MVALDALGDNERLRGKASRNMVREGSPSLEKRNFMVNRQVKTIYYDNSDNVRSILSPVYTLLCPLS